MAALRKPGLALVALLPLMLGGCYEGLATSRVKAGLVDAGMPEKSAECAAKRMVERLSLRQLWKLQAFQGEKTSVRDYIAAVREVDDAEVLSVTVSSAALCATGLAG